ncbi:FAD-dependent monooxygenase [Gulosibacter molinativorax]|uniref:FAD-binding protein n=1 Tax=Gulosibacter molinativorax TaxID=256821 RepID=A0ABT7CAZ9_9MICO|nr:FAD-dependent monooxygenase [Gulosibacter molinativorax]MDJ1371937.1 FAD-binding protein [Gulosibacter molinativorax]QUY62699.1 3-hydroxybenzoate 6-hydroxylase 1 [Gulosibacter molinativorax]
MTRGKALIVGGGIGGLSTAIALANADYEVRVVEQHEDLRSSIFGVGIIQPINALRALKMLGVLDECLDQGFPAKAWGAMYDVDGNFLHEMAGSKIEDDDLPPMNGLTRPKLHKILTDATLAAGARIDYSTAFSELTEEEDGVVVTLADGSSDKYDFVVGADGVRSAVRLYVLDAELQPRYIGQSAYRLNIPREPEIDRIILQEGPKGMAGLVPIGKDMAYLFFNAEMPREGRPQGAELVSSLREYLSDYKGITGKIRDKYLTEDADIVLRPEESLMAYGEWHNGRVVLIGDAVHAITPHLGQGAAQAIEDGVVLADSLVNAGSLEEAFANYTERRFERCKLIVETSLAIGEWECGHLDDFDNVAATNHVLEIMAQPL